MKAKTIIITAIGIDEFMCVSHYKTAEEMWDTFQVTYEGTIDVKKDNMNTLIYEYEFFRIKAKEHIQYVEKYFIQCY